MATCDPKVWRDTHYGNARETLKVQMIYTMAMYDPKVWRDLNYGDETLRYGAFYTVAMHEKP